MSDNSEVQKLELEAKKLKLGIENDRRTTEELKLYNHHFSRMARTLGKSPARQLKWLVSFLHSDLAGLPDEQRQALRCDFTFLASYGTQPHTEKKKLPFLSGEKTWWFALFGNPSAVLPADNYLESCHRIFSEKVSAFLDRHHVQFDLQAFGPTILHVINKPDKNPRLYLECATGEQSLEWWLASLLTEHGQNLRRCRQCQTIFIVRRKDTSFCSPKCRGLFNMRTIRKTPQDRYGKRGRPKKQADKSKGSGT